jgi:hypothetical protein
MNWNDELCGVKVTPEAWLGGIVEYKGRWYSPRSIDTDFDDWDLYYSETKRLRHVKIEQTTPIFPPAGWAGKSDAELWDAVFGISLPCIADGLGMYAPQKWGCDEWHVNVGEDGTVWCYCRDSTEIEEPEMLKRPDLLILALTNAQVLARRLQEARNG